MPLTPTSLSANDLLRMRADQVLHHFDECQVLRLVSPAPLDEYGKPILTYEVIAPYVTCGLEFPASNRDLDTTGAEQEALYASLRLPHGLDAHNHDRIRVTKRFGYVLDTPLTFDIDGEPGLGPSGLVANLVLVVDGTHNALAEDA